MSTQVENHTKVGTLSDFDIKSFCSKKILIEDNYDEEKVKQACYELRAGYTYYDISNGAKKCEISLDNYILIKPKQTVVIITFESLLVPANFLGRISAKGYLFSLGIIPVNTFADPGFSGNLGIVLNNMSNNYIKIKPLEGIAKIEFSMLEQLVERPYNGQHGYQTNIWPLRNDLILTEEEIKNDCRIFNNAKEIEISYGRNIGTLIKRVFRFERWLIGSSILYFTFTILLIGFMMLKNVDGQRVIEPITSIFLGVGSNIIFGLISWFATSMARRK